MTKKISELTDEPSPQTTDIIELTVDPGGSPLTRSVQLGTLGSIPGLGGLLYVEVTGTTQAMVDKRIYGANNAAQVTLTLPSNPGDGALVQVVGIGDGGFKVAQNAGDQVIFSEDGVGFGRTTVGVTGTIESTDDFDVIRLICVNSDAGGSAWRAEYANGVFELT